MFINFTVYEWALLVYLKIHVLCFSPDKNAKFSTISRGSLQIHPRRFSEDGELWGHHETPWRCECCRHRGWTSSRSLLLSLWKNQEHLSFQQFSTNSCYQWWDYGDIYFQTCFVLRSRFVICVEITRYFRTPINKFRFSALHPDIRKKVLIKVIRN